MSRPTVIFYTYEIEGKLETLPRLFTYLKTLRADYGKGGMRSAFRDLDDDPRFLLLDLGASCLPDLWHCQATSGRSALVVLDAMGYHAANVAGMLTDAARARLGDLLHVALVDTTHRYHHDEFLLTDGRLATRDPGGSALEIVVAPGDHTRLETEVVVRGQPGVLPRLTFARVAFAYVGIVQLSAAHQVVNHNMLALPPATPPDPTIAGVLDFVMSEARQAQKRGAR